MSNSFLDKAGLSSVLTKIKQYTLSKFIDKSKLELHIFSSDGTDYTNSAKLNPTTMDGKQVTNAYIGIVGDLSTTSKVQLQSGENIPFIIYRNSGTASLALSDSNILTTTEFNDEVETLENLVSDCKNLCYAYTSTGYLSLGGGKMKSNSTVIFPGTSSIRLGQQPINGMTKDGSGEIILYNNNSNFSNNSYIKFRSENLYTIGTYETNIKPTSIDTNTLNSTYVNTTYISSVDIENSGDIKNSGDIENIGEITSTNFIAKSRYYIQHSTNINDTTALTIAKTRISCATNLSIYNVHLLDFDTTTKVMTVVLFAKYSGTSTAPTRLVLLDSSSAYAVGLLNYVGTYYVGTISFTSVSGPQMRLVTATSIK